jgi:O-antigen/teichoic acid export membrane protein
MSIPDATSESSAADSSSAGPTVGQRAARGVLWNFTQVLSSKVLVALAQVALGWLLVKKDFGQIGLAFTVTTFINLLTAPGIDTVLVQRQKKICLWITPAAWMSLGLGLIGALVTLAAAPLAAAIYQTPQVAGLVAVLALAAPAAALAVTPRAMLEAQMRFRRIAAITLTGTLVSSTLSVLLAYLGWGAYSLVAPVVVAQILMTSLYWWQVRPPIRFRPHLRVWRYMIGDTAYVFLTRLAITIVGQADYIVLGLFYAADVVGVYFFAFWFASQGLRLIGSSISSTLFSAFTKLQAEPERMVESALRSARVVGLVALPMCLWQALITAPLFHIVYGNRWDQAILPAQLLSIGFATDAIGWVGGALLQAQRRLKLLAGIAGMFTVIFVTSVTLGAWWRAEIGVAVAVLLYYTVCSPLSFYLALRPSGASVTKTAQIFAKPWLIGLASFGLAHLTSLLAAQLALTLGVNLVTIHLVRIAVVTVVGGGAYMVLAKRWFGPELTELVHRLKNRNARS